MSGIKLCKDCKYYRPGYRARVSACVNDEYGAINYVTGGIHHFLPPISLRASGPCGPAGRGWTSKGEQ